MFQCIKFLKFCAFSSLTHDLGFIFIMESIHAAKLSIVNWLANASKLQLDDIRCQSFLEKTLFLQLKVRVAPIVNKMRGSSIKWLDLVQ